MRKGILLSALGLALSSSVIKDLQNRTVQPVIDAGREPPEKPQKKSFAEQRLRDKQRKMELRSKRR